MIVSTILFAAAIAIVFLRADLGPFFAAFQKFSAPAIGLIFAALLANALLAAFRFRVIAADVGHPITFSQAMAAVSGGTLGGAAFFQIAGQLMARGIVMARAGIPFASVVMMTAYERLVSAIISALLAVAGAYFIFGRIFVDQNVGGADLIKTAIGLIAAAGTGAALGYGRTALRSAAPILTQHFVARLARMIGLCLLVQLPMMAAYIAAGSALAPHLSLQSIAAASAIVMFAASIPISFAGWGVRELSAVLALSAIGMDASDALVAAVTIGIGSLIAMVLMAATAWRGWTARSTGRGQIGSAQIDYARALALAVPVAAGTLVLFQIYIPISSGTLLNVNLADPLAILGGALFILSAVRERQLPRWRLPRLNAMVAVATLILALSLLIGFARYGWTEWAWVNRFLGWFVLLGFAATGAMIVKDAGANGLRILLLTYAGATAAIAALEICLSTLNPAGLHLLSVLGSHIEGFALNRNSFALQILIAIAATLVAARGQLPRATLLTILLVALVLTGSRSGSLAIAFVLAAAIYMRATNWREVLRIVVAGAAGILAVGSIPLVQVGTINIGLAAALLPSDTSTTERLTTIFLGFELFFQHPIFGAGLGAFRNLTLISGAGVPLVIHSTPVWLLAELGLVGFLVFSAPAIYLLTKEVRRTAPDLGAQIVVLSLVVFAVMSAPADMLYQRTFWLMLGAGLALLPSMNTGKT